jgi:hypothetical protein
MQVNFFTIRACAAVIMLASLFAASSACGKRSAPLPPRDRVTQVATLSGFQRGNQVILSWQMPPRNAAKGSVQNISRADVYRLAEPLNSPVQISEVEFANRSTVIATMPISDSDFGLTTLQYKDTLQFASQPARLRYAIRFVNAGGQKAGFSNALLIEPTSRIAAGPTDLTATYSQDAVRLRWQAPASNVDGTTPASVLGYYLYRSIAANEPAKPLNKTPITATSFEDEFFEFGREYLYFVRAVSAGVQAEPVESIESNILRIKPVDTFAPTAPSAITVAAGPTSISLFFAINPEKDVIGYKVYRSEDTQKPKEQWEVLTPTLLKANTFQDRRVVAGKTYFYYITATDAAGNLSEPSETASETVPQ